MSRRPILAGKWKMNLDHLEAIALVQQFVYHLEAGDYAASEIVVIPPFTALRSLQTLIEGDKLPLGLGAQNCHWETNGAFTGEVSPPMLARLKCRYVICGHSERRTLFGETNDVVNRKLRAVLAHDMTPILCVGESLEQRESDEAETVVVGQVTACLQGVTDEQVGAMVLAYEPIWAIGTGRTATPDDAQEMCAVLRRTVADVAGADAATTVRIQYGGSVKPGNVAALMACEDIDGALVGGASTDAEDFAVICRHHRL
ncbi:MAG: triose-phosphate isomerase [Egibacteraceae bacterium]